MLQLSELYTDDYIFDRFSCCASKDGAYFATGSYRFLHALSVNKWSPKVVLGLIF